MNFSTIWQTFVNACMGLAWKLLAAILVLVLGNLIIKLVLHIVKKSKGMNKIDPTVRGFTVSFIKIGLYAVLVTVLVAILGVETASIIAVFASCGAAIALALQGSLANFAGGIMLLIFKPFNAGEYIDAPDFGGTVSEIGIFYTTLITPDNKHITVPNSTILNSVITNYSKEKTRRLEIEWFIDCRADLAEVERIILSEVAKHDNALGDPAPAVVVKEVSETAAAVALRLWCAGSDFWSLKFALTKEIKTEFDKNGIHIPHRQMDVSIKKD